MISVSNNCEQHCQHLNRQCEHLNESPLLLYVHPCSMSAPASCSHRCFHPPFRRDPDASPNLLYLDPTPDAMKLVVGGMMERGGSTASIEAFGKKKECGLFKQPCLLDYHAQVRC